MRSAVLCDLLFCALCAVLLCAVLLCAVLLCAVLRPLLCAGLCSVRAVYCVLSASCALCAVRYVLCGVPCYAVQCGGALLVLKATPADPAT